VLALVGAADLLKSGDIPLRWLFLGTLACNWLFTFTYPIPDIDTFYTVGYVVIAILIASGAAAIRKWLQPFLHSRALGAIVGLTLVCLVLGPRAVALSHEDARSASVSEDVRANAIRATVDALPSNATVFLDWNALYAHIYVATVERRRSDLRFVEAKPYSSTPGLAASLIEFARASLERGPVFFARRWPSLDAAALALTPTQVGPATLYQLHRGRSEVR